MTNRDLLNLRHEFPILDQVVNDEPLIYFDNAATSQTPQSVIDAMVAFYHQDHANVHRGVHTLSERATQAYENGREEIARFVGAESSACISFSSGTTDSINKIARGLIEPRLKHSDIILTTRLEHHSNLVPWQEVCKRTGAQLKFMDLNQDFQVDLKSLATKYDHQPIKAIVIQHFSNVLGVEQPIQSLSQWAHQQGALLIVDGAQASPHTRLHLNDWQVDAYAFSSHKMYGPMGLGITYLAKEHHDTCLPVNFGGEMIHLVEDQYANYKQAPWKFEAGTQAIAQVIGLTQAIRWIESIGFDNIQSQEQLLGRRLYHGLKELDDIILYTPESAMSHGIISFNIQGVHPHDAATGFDQLGIAVRAGHHCAQPLMRLLETPATLRASLMVYNTVEEVDRFIQATKEIKEFFTYGT
ncbi:SufS family cysteine desulfurase [Facklamia miroungae]|uniref:cysteine desulfurase n=1 Tax=Facklamia miroungae TaxID=120956 RepID=A0A1G7SN43_9LACT|nr:SufS family cysteine desulfurase [Facklamia miroungae]NKZ29591.1 SufS family cysteine desulfurase [Facklamia miroungae]SDG24475.1 cysteine desulfurase / selenocysteine lyase [Facklamia miroungae]